MATKEIEIARAIWASKAFRRKCLTPITERQNRSKQVAHDWPPSFVIRERTPAFPLSDEIALWDQASDEDFSSFENELE